MKLLIDKVHNLWYAYFMAKKYIYGLRCPVYNEVKYIGASQNPNTRFKQHMREAGPARWLAFIDYNPKYNKRNVKKRHQWIERLKALGMAPILEVYTPEPIESWAIMEARMYNIVTIGGGELYQESNRLG